MQANLIAEATRSGGAGSIRVAVGQRSTVVLRWSIQTSMRALITLTALSLFLVSCARQPTADVVLRNGLVCNGSGSPCVAGGIAVRGDRITAVGEVGSQRGRMDIDVHGQVIAPGFINMMSSDVALFGDGRGLSDIMQGVTLEIMGEGESMGPLNEAMRAEATSLQADIRYDVKWNTLREGLETLVARGISPNVASFIGAATPRVYVLGRAKRAPTPAELDRMRQLTAQAMQEGALGVASALIYAPGNYASTDELVALAEVAARHGGIYISHIRNEGNGELAALNEFLEIARKARIPAEIYHLKVAGARNWGRMSDVIRRIEDARASGLQITADMYPYTAGATGLDAAMPPWVQEGGLEEWRKRLQDPSIRRRVKAEMASVNGYDNLLAAAGSADRVLLTGFKTEKLKPLTGKTLGEVARLRNTSPEETAMDLVVEDGSRVETIYFLMSEDNVRRQIALPWISFGSDYGPEGIDGVFLKSSAHPRAFGTFARVFAKYVREEKLLSVAEAVRRMTSLPAGNLAITDRGLLKPQNIADIVVFDVATVQDRATFEKPRQLTGGVSHVFVNGVHVVRDGAHTGAKPGRVVTRGRR